MGHKVNPKILRVGINRTWQSKWFDSGKKYIKNIKQDVQLRKSLTKKLINAGIDKIEIERNANKVIINIFTAKPGVVIGKGGTGAEKLRKEIHDNFLKNIYLNDIKLNIHEVERPNLSAQIVAQSMVLELEKRMPFRRVMKQAINRVERAGALGVKIITKGRLNGAEIARSEKLTSGKVPLHTLRADIDYCRVAAGTTYGALGVRVWIYKGEIFNKKKEEKGEVVGGRIKAL